MRGLSVLILVALPTYLVAQPPTNLSDATKVCIGSMGKSDNADRFRMLLDEELTKAKVPTTEVEGECDAVLTGVLATRTIQDETAADATVVLRNKDGQRLWGGDFKTSFWWKSDDVRDRARAVASALSKAWRRSHKQ